MHPGHLQRSRRTFGLRNGADPNLVVGYRSMAPANTDRGGRQRGHSEWLSAERQFRPDLALADASATVTDWEIRGSGCRPLPTAAAATFRPRGSG